MIFPSQKNFEDRNIGTDVGPVPIRLKRENLSKKKMKFVIVLTL